MLKLFLRILAAFLITPWWKTVWKSVLVAWDKSFQLPVARFWPPCVQVLGAIWLGLPDDRLKDLTKPLGFGTAGDRWPYETAIILVLIILSTIYGVEYGHRIQEAISAEAAETGAQNARTDTEREEFEAMQSLIRNQIATIEDPIERWEFTEKLTEILQSDTENQ